jgi:Zn-dependent protease/CBS domain-containing protein
MRVARLFGIDIYIDVSWLFVFVLVAWSLTVSLGPMHALALSPGGRLALGVVTTLFFFASVLAHELAHSLVARARGLKVSRITLFIFGGVSQLSGDFENAEGEGLVAFVGPLMSFVLAGVFYVCAVLFGFGTPAGVGAGYLAYANAILAVFNLLPAYPLDGGKVLHSLLWRSTGDQLRATRIAALVGRTIAIGIIALGAVAFIAGSFGGLWFAFIGWFLFQAGGQESLQTELSATLRGRSAMDVATLPPPPASPTEAARDVMERLLRSGQRAMPVVDGSKLVGLVTLTDLARLGARGDGDVPVSSVMTTAAELKSVRPDAASSDALKVLAESGYHQVPVIDASGALVGFVTREGLLRRISLGTAPKAAQAAR